MYNLTVLRQYYFLSNCKCAYEKALLEEISSYIWQCKQPTSFADEQYTRMK